MDSSADQFHVRWNNYTTVLQSVFRKLLQGEQFVDVSLACEGKTIKCHRVVLSACSVYFEKLLTDNSFPHLVIYIKDMKYWELQALVTFMYNGEVSVNQNKLASLVKAAESLKIKGLAPDSSLNDNDNERIDEDDIEEYHVGTKYGNDLGGKRSLLRFPQPPKQLKRKVNVAPPKLVKMQKIDRQTNGVGIMGGNSVKTELKQEYQHPSDDEESFPHETAASSEMSLKDNEDEEDLEESLEVSVNPVDDDVDGHTSASEVEEPEAHVPTSAGGSRSRFAYKYGKDVRDSALAALSSGMSLRQCSEAFGIPRKTLSKWKNRDTVLDDQGVGEQVDDTLRRQAMAIASQAEGVVQDGGDRAERLQKAMELAVSGVTVRQAAAHYAIPRTTLCAYLKRRGVAPKRNFLPSSASSRKIGASSKVAQSQNASQYEDFSQWGRLSEGLSEMMDEMGQGSYNAEDQK